MFKFLLYSQIIGMNASAFSDANVADVHARYTGRIISFDTLKKCNRLYINLDFSLYFS